MSLLFISLSTFSQLKCKKTTNQKLEMITTCYHKNDSVSTVEIWDKDNRSGSVKAFDNQGKQLCHYYLRSFGGHASATIGYYPNGQVSRVDYSSAPDGGIQFYKSTIKFDEFGTKTDFSEMKYPPEPIMITTPKTQQPPPSKTVECAVLMSDFYEIKNGTKSKVSLYIKTKSNPNYAKKEFYLTLKPNENIIFDSLVSAQFHPKEAIYELSILSYTKKRKQKMIQIGTAINEDKSKNQKTWTWVLF